MAACFALACALGRFKILLSLVDRVDRVLSDFLYIHVCARIQKYIYISQAAETAGGSVPPPHHVRGVRAGVG